MDKEELTEFDYMTIMKEKRRVSRSKGKQTDDQYKTEKPKMKQRVAGNFSYNPDFDYDHYDYDVLDKR